MEDIARGVRSFTLGTAVSRVLGLARESVFAALFGAGTAMDAFNVAFRIPNLLRDLLAETALSAAFVPVLTAEKVKGPEARNRLASNVLSTLALVTAGLTIAGILLSPWLSRQVAAGFADVPGKLDLTARLTAIMFPFLFLICLAAWAMSFLNTEKSFFVPAAAPAFFNVFSIAVPVALFGVLEARGIPTIYGAAAGVLAGGLMQFLVQIPRVAQRGFRYAAVLDWRDPTFRRVMALFGPVAIGLAGARVNVVVNTILSARLEEGSVSWLNYAYRVMHLPLGLFGAAVGTVALPALSTLVLRKDVAGVRSMLSDSIRMALALTVPAAVLMAFLAGPITRVIFQRGRFTAADAAATALALALYSLGIPFLAALRNVAAVYYAHNDARSPMLASLASIALNLVLNVSLMSTVGFAIFPIATSLAAALNVFLLISRLPRKTGRWEWGPLAEFCLKLGTAALAGGAAAWFTVRAAASLTGPGFWPSLASLAAAGGLGLLVFYAASRALRLAEVRQLLHRFLR